MHLAVPVRRWSLTGTAVSIGRGLWGAGGPRGCRETADRLSANEQVEVRTYPWRCAHAPIAGSAFERHHASMGYLSRQEAISKRARRAGRKRAAFWRKIGWPNLRMAWEARRRNAAIRRRCKLLGAPYVPRKWTREELLGTDDALRTEFDA